MREVWLEWLRRICFNIKLANSRESTGWQNLHCFYTCAIFQECVCWCDAQSINPPEEPLPVTDPPTVIILRVLSDHFFCVIVLSTSTAWPWKQLLSNRGQYNCQTVLFCVNHFISTLSPLLWIFPSLSSSSSIKRQSTHSTHANDFSDWTEALTLKRLWYMNLHRHEKT